MDSLARLEASIAQTRNVVVGTTPEQFTASTPCADWDVQALANHLLGALVMFHDVASNGAADMAVLQGDHVGENFVASFDNLSAATVAAWKVGDRMTGTANMPWGEMPADVAVAMLADDVLVHGWDLAQSSGQQVDWDQALAGETLDFARMIFAAPENREGSFGASVPVAAEADAMTQLIAFLGRNP